MGGAFVSEDAQYAQKKGRYTYPDAEKDTHQRPVKRLSAHEKPEKRGYE